MKIKIKQHLTATSKANLEAASHAILVLPADLNPNKWPEMPASQLVQDGLTRWPKDTLKGGILTLNLPNRSQTRLVCTQLGEDSSQFALLGLARRLISASPARTP